MRLKQLKLAGFKSFVDAVTIPLPSQLVAVVGPNGCGKSNVIDAVRWVMGESQAKQLRGEAMTDVIFKGSANRKSIGQASVELIFDNSLGKIAGPFASYQEIAVKRTVNRDGESTYFLNGTRCRRRDITDIFLGTGVGARGYSVIGQDTISKLIEARPEELRAYLEEAAGVSKYKERRRETMQRIAQTRENLARVADIQAELAKQLARLERQAKMAQRYLQYKQEEQAHRFAIHALKWRDLHAEQQRCQSTHEQIQRECDTYQTQLVLLQKNHVTQQETLRELTAHQEATQQLFYQNKTELVRLEEAIQHQKARQQQLILDEQRLIQELAQTEQQLQADETSCQLTQNTLQTLQAERQAIQIALDHAQIDLDGLEKKELAWREAWSANLKILNEIEREEQLEKLKQKHQEEREAQLKIQYERQQQVLGTIQEAHLAAEVSLAKIKQEETQIVYQALLQSYQIVLDQIDAARQQHLQIEQQLHQTHDTLQLLTEEHAALKAAQHAAFNQINVSSTNTYSRVVEHLSVDDAWRLMAEQVLGDGLQAFVVDNLASVLPELEELRHQSMLFTQALPISAKTSTYPRLMDKLHGTIPDSCIDVTQILAANHLQQALAWLPSIPPEQSIVTPDGYWLGNGWIRVFDLKPADEGGLLTRQHRLSQLDEQIRALNMTRQLAIEERDRCYHLLGELQNQQTQLQKQKNEAAEGLRLAQRTYEQATQAESHALSQKHQAVETCEAVLIELESSCALQQEIEAALIALTTKSHVAKDHQKDLLLEKERWDKQWQEAKTAYQTIYTTFQTLTLQYSQEETKYSHLQQQIQRSRQQWTMMTERQMQLQAQLSDLHMPLIEMQEILDDKLRQHQHLESCLVSERQELTLHQERLQEIDQLCKYEEQRVKALQSQLQQLILQEQTLLTRALNHTEALAAMNQHWEAHLNALPAELTVAQSEAALAQVESNITRLGPINLLAVEEYTADLTRKSHLDTQANDLTEALGTLECAIAKMDQETQQRFKNTFDEVNAAFQSLFPRLFGGGHATLEMTCDNLLEAGVLVMAQPPGKRNNTIYMLSGGEKAMTAVALVFAIFQLNPSPFCMLDEVDAPLDEANVRRFSELVREMSQMVQFLLITHNKVTMEIAEHLIGVTMREPGVSRIVSVDVTTMV